MASTGVSEREMLDVGAKAAASRRVWYPKERAYETSERGDFEFVIFDCPVRANKLGARSFDRGLLRRRTFFAMHYVWVPEIDECLAYLRRL